MEFMYDDMLTMYRLTPRLSTIDHIAFLKIGRKLALTAWTAYTRLLESLIIEQQY